MSDYHFDERELPGYFLGEDSQFRLLRLKDHLRFLARLAQPRTVDEEREDAPQVRRGELSFCMELLADQVHLVLDELSWPAHRTTADTAIREAGADATTELADAPADDIAFGLTLDQLDTLDRLLQTLSAYGDVVAASDPATLANPTLPALGRAIVEATAAVREVLAQVEGQRRGKGRRARSGVAEAAPAYGARLH